MGRAMRGPRSDRVLANAQSHAGKARLEHQQRWAPSGYATHATLGVMIGLVLLSVRPRMP